MSHASNIYWPKPVKNVCVAEIGIKHGDTTILLARHLSNNGKIYVYDYQDRVEKVVERCASEGYTNIVGMGNNYKLFDSYNWSLAQTIKIHGREMFDYIYFDGAHTWHHDALAAVLCMRLLKVGGYLDVDDCDHRYIDSPNAAPHLAVQHIEQAQRPRTEDAYTEEQISTKQVQLVIDLIIKEDDRFDEIVPNKIYRKVQR